MIYLNPATTIVILDRCYRGSSFTPVASAHGLPIEAFGSDSPAASFFFLPFTLRSRSEAKRQYAGIQGYTR